MNNGLIIDGMFVLILLVSFLVGAKRGLFKSLMGLVVVIAAVLGATMIADAATPPVTDFLVPKVEQKVTEWLGIPQEMTMEQFLSGTASSDFTTSQTFSEWFGKLSRWGASSGFLAHMKDKTANAAQTAARSLVESTIHTLLFLLSFIILLILLKLLTKTLDHIFNLPVLDTLNTAGGGIFGLLEVLALIYLVLLLAPRLGITFFRDNADATYLLKFFMTHTPFTVISTVASLNGGN